MKELLKKKEVQLALAAVAVVAGLWWAGVLTQCSTSPDVAEPTASESLNVPGTNVGVNSNVPTPGPATLTTEPVIITPTPDNKAVNLQQPTVVKPVETTTNFSE